MRGSGVMDFYKLKSSDYEQREGKCVVDWLYHHVKHSGRIISQRWYEKRFYDFCGKDIDSNRLCAFIKSNHKNISLIILDGTGGIIKKVIASKRGKSHIFLGAVCSDNHL